jgi:hypothetical protein
MKLTTRYAVGAREVLAEIFERQKGSARRIPHTAIAVLGLDFDETVEHPSDGKHGPAVRQEGGKHVELD